MESCEVTNVAAPYWGIAIVVIKESPETESADEPRTIAFGRRVAKSPKWLLHTGVLPCTELTALCC
jgi:hypothetical protein